MSSQMQDLVDSLRIHSQLRAEAEEVEAEVALLPKQLQCLW
jgi:hypothetical protein